MKLLFIDTETSGVEPSKDQIIEVGAVIFEVTNFELKLVDHFQTTISLRKVLDERITRITGITEGELATAPSLVKAQESYNSWIEKYDNQITAIVGHSIDFDIGFLAKEGWFLPTDKYIDTLDLAKVMLPNMQAINLEFLSKKIGFGDNLCGISAEGLSYHRALYDSIMCANLFAFILKKINVLECSQDFADQLCQLILPNGIILYKSNTKKLSHHNNENIALEISQNQIVNNQIEFTGLPATIPINSKIQNLQYSPSLESALHWTLPKEYKIIILQLYTISIWNSFGIEKYTKNPKLHSLGVGFWVANFVLQGLVETPKSNHSELLNPENIIDQLQKIADNQINFETIATYLEILTKILCANGIPDQNIINWISQYEFFMITLHPFLMSFEYKINFAAPLPQERIISQKFLTLLQSLKNLQLPNISNLDCYDITVIIEDKIIEFINQIQFSPLKIYTFKRTGNKHLFVTCFDDQFDLNNHFKDILQKQNLESVQTYLSEQNLLLLLDLGKVEIDIFNKLAINFKIDYEYQCVDGIARFDFVVDNINLAKKQNKPVLILCGQNSSLKNLDKTCSDYDLMNDVLIIGESGGITKIASKIDQGFVGVVIIKFSSVDYFYNLYKIPSFAKILLYDRPYFFINEYWYLQSKISKKYAPDNYLKTLKEIFIQTQINRLSSNFDCPIDLAYNLF